MHNKNNMRLIMFMSRRLEPVETHYANTEEEALAIVCFLREVKWLVDGSPYPIKVYTEHSALKTFLKQDDDQSRLGYWQVKLPRYDIDYIHIPGCQNQVADGLSSMPSLSRIGFARPGWLGVSHTGRLRNAISAEMDFLCYLIIFGYGAA